MVAPVGTRSRSLRSPATEAALAGSQKNTFLPQETVGLENFLIADGVKFPLAGCLHR